MAPLAVYPADSGDRLPEALAASPLNIGRPGPRLGASINGAQAMTSVIVARVATLLIKYAFIGVTSITLGVLAFGVITGILA